MENVTYLEKTVYCGHSCVCKIECSDTMFYIFSPKILMRLGL